MKYLLLLFVSFQVTAGPLVDPAQCKVAMVNWRKVTVWSEHRVREMYWECMAHAQTTAEGRYLMQQNLDEAVKLRQTFENSVTVEHWQ